MPTTRVRFVRELRRPACDAAGSDPASWAEHGSSWRPRVYARTVPEPRAGVPATSDLNEWGSQIPMSRARRRSRCLSPVQEAVRRR